MSRFWYYRLTPTGPVDVLSEWNKEPSGTLPGLPPVRPVREVDTARLAEAVRRLEAALPAFLDGDTRGVDLLNAIRRDDRDEAQSLHDRCHWGRAGFDEIENALHWRWVVACDADAAKYPPLLTSLAVVRAAMETAVDAAYAYLARSYVNGTGHVEIMIEKEPGTSLDEHRQRAESVIAQFRANPQNLRPL